MWIRLRLFKGSDVTQADPKSYKDIYIHSYDELIRWMEKNLEMWQLVTVETDYICKANNPADNINVRNVYYVFE